MNTNFSVAKRAFHYKMKRLEGPMRAKRKKRTKKPRKRPKT